MCSAKKAANGAPLLTITPECDETSAPCLASPEPPAPPSGGSGHALLNGSQSAFNEMTELQQRLASKTSLVSARNIKAASMYGNGLFDRVLVMPEARTIVCGIEKCGITTMAHVAQLVNRLANFHWWQSSPDKFNTSFGAFLTLLGNPWWRSVVVYRDPIDRFVSAFQNKCLLKDRDGAKHCHRVFRLNASQMSMEAVAAGLPAYGYSNPHWIPQSHFCGGTVRSAWASYTHHILLSNLSRQLPDLFHDRVPDKTRASIRSYLAASQGPRNSHVTHASDTRVPVAVRQQLVDFYWEDYRLFLTNGVSAQRS